MPEDTTAGSDAGVPPDADGTSRDWLKPNPIFVDHFSTDIFDDAGVVRISFGEWLGSSSPAIYRSAVAMSSSDAKELANLLLRLVARHEDDQKDTESKSTPGQKNG